MTETTDIKALRSEAANIIGLLTSEGHQSFTLDKTADFLDDVFRLLEAEHQRLELVREQRDNELKTNSQLEAELASLRGTQEPVAWEWQDGNQRHVTNDEERVRDLAWDGVKLTPLAACQPKPVCECTSIDYCETHLKAMGAKPVVVLPETNGNCLSCDRHFVDGMRQGWNFRDADNNQGFIDAIERVQKDMRGASREAAGIAVKDGE